jgi:hypothetical protein
MESTITAQLATNSSETIEDSHFLDFWFGTPDQGSLNDWTLLSLAVLSTLLVTSLGVIFAVKLLNSKLTPPQQKFLTKVVFAVAPFGFIGWVLILSRLVGVVFISARFWWIFWFLTLFGVGFWVARQRKKLQTLQVQFRSYQLKKRYFPAKNKR